MHLLKAVLPTQWKPIRLQNWNNRFQRFQIQPIKSPVQNNEISTRLLWCLQLWCLLTKLIVKLKHLEISRERILCYFTLDFTFTTMINSLDLSYLYVVIVYRFCWQVQTMARQMLCFTPLNADNPVLFQIAQHDQVNIKIINANLFAILWVFLVDLGNWSEFFWLFHPSEVRDLKKS